MFLGIDDINIADDYFKSWSPFHYKDSLSSYGYFCFKDKMVMRLSYLYNGNPYTGKMIYIETAPADMKIFVFWDIFSSMP